MTLPSPSRPFRRLGFALALMLAAAPLSAASYRLVAGDRIEVSHVGLEEPVQLTVDTDGQIRLVDIGGIDVIGQTLDEVEAQISQKVSEAGLFVDTRVSVLVADYAPVVVAGDVAAPGRLDYTPGMTVATALAASGGTEAVGISQLDAARARTDARSLLDTLNLDIAGTMARVARLEAALSEAPVDSLQPELISDRIPAPGTVPLESLMETERDLLRSEREQAETLMAFWEEEIATIEDQRRLFDERIALQNEIIASTNEALESARALQERGLQTAAGLLSAEQRASDAKASALELESAQVAAARARSDAQRARTQFLADRRQAALSGLQQGRLELDELQLRYARAVEQLALLTNGGAGALLDSATVTLGYRLLSPRPDRGATTEVDEETLLLPGDTLIVTVSASAIDTQG